MWTSKCAYVKKLIGPFDIEEKYRLAFAAKPENMSATLYRYFDVTSPVGRYTAEIFIGTHPALTPCVYNAKGVRAGLGGQWLSTKILSLPLTVGGKENNVT
jgi:hypothetical protein